MRPSKVSILSEKPKASITPKVPISEIGTATIGIIVALQLCSDRNTTSITSSNASNRVRYTWWMEADMYVVISNGMAYVIPSGKLRPISSIVSFTCPATSIALAPGNMLIFNTAAFPPSMPLSVEYEDASREMRATSFSLIIDPSGLARTTICSNSFTDDRRPWAVIGIVMSTSSIGASPSTPAADSRFWSRRTDCKSLTVNPRSASLSGCTQMRIA